MHQLKALSLALLLSACAANPVLEPARFRSADAPMWSNAQFDVSRLSGQWRQVAGFATTPDGCKPGGIEVTGPAPRQSIAARLCLNGQTIGLSGPITTVGPGRIRVAEQEWWVIWVDTDYRTLAIGTPSGAFGFVLNRGAGLPADRIRAAREIFDFNGYDTAKLDVF